MADSEDYKQSAVNSFRLAVELFNRPYDEGRLEAVLIQLNHAFEMLLKGAILEQGGRIRDDDGDSVIYRVELASGETMDFRRRDIRPPLD